jgi:thiol-disulfide isomerase/thioredoxin/uncharacterized membrane protein YphA (DoxX/SURF4 family)
LVILARLALTAVFALAGISKLASISSTRESVIQFGVPPRIATVFTIGLVTCELAVAIALIPPTTAWYAAIAATALLALFSLAIAANLLRGKRPTCNCFGQLHPTEIGWPTFARDLVLVVIALSIVVSPEDATLNLFAWSDGLSALQMFSVVAGAFALLLLLANAVLLVQVLRQQGRMLLRFETIEQHLGIASNEASQPSGLPLGSPAPSFELPTLDGGSVNLEALLQPKKPALLVFSNPGCGPCLALVPEIARWQQDLRDALTIALVSEGTTDDNREKFAGSGIINILVQNERATAEAFGAYGTPAAVMIAPDGRIASHLATGSEAIRQLVYGVHADALQPAMASPGISTGDELPDIVLKTLGGDDFALSSIRGEPALLVFWNQSCGFCLRMIPELREWEAGADVGAPRVFLISSSSAEEHDDLDLASNILLDPESRASATFGARGTPMGILIDEHGRIASHIVAGASEIFALANRATGVRANGSLV